MFRKTFGLLVYLCAFVQLSHARSAGPPANVNGLSGQYCTQCHRTNALNTGNGSVRIEGLPATWVAGQVYSLRVVVSHDAAIRWGFQLSATTAAGQQAGALEPGSDGRTLVQKENVDGSDIQFINHNSLGSAIGGSNTFEFTYRAPTDASAGTIRFYVAGNAANGNGANTGDFIYATQASVPPGLIVTDNRAFSLSNRGLMSMSTAGTSASVAVGHARIQTDSGNLAPAAAAILSLRQNNVTVSEAAFATSTPARSGRIYTEVAGTVNTGVAIVNPNAEAAAVSFYFTDENGSNFGNGSVLMGANAETAAFIDQAPFYRASPFIPAINRAMTFTFTSTVPVSVMAVRGSDKRPLGISDGAVTRCRYFLNVHRARCHSSCRRRSRLDYGSTAGESVGRRHCGNAAIFLIRRSDVKCDHCRPEHKSV